MSQVVWNQMSQRRCRLLRKSVTRTVPCPGPRPRTKYGQQERECINSINTSTSPYVLICRILILIFRADHITAAAPRCSASAGSRVTRRARRSGQQWTAAARQWVRRTQIQIVTSVCEDCEAMTNVTTLLIRSLLLKVPPIFKQNLVKNN